MEQPGGLRDLATLLADLRPRDLLTSKEVYAQGETIPVISYVETWPCWRAVGEERRSRTR